MAYDAASRQVTIQDGPTRVTFTFDNNGSTTVEKRGPLTTNYIYNRRNRERIIFSSDLSREDMTYDGDGLSPGAKLTSVTTYATVNGRLVQENRGGVVTRYVADTLGSVIQTRDASGNQTSSTTYWPFGEVRTSSGNNPSPWGFCGTWGYFTDATNRLYVRARSLRVDLSRCMTLDPFWPEEPSYGYGMNNPITVTDATGEKCKPCTDHLLGLPDEKAAINLIRCLRNAGQSQSAIQACLDKFGGKISDKSWENIKKYIACVMASRTDPGIRNPPCDACQPPNPKWALSCCYQKFLNCLFNCTGKKGVTLNLCIKKCEDAKGGFKDCLAKHCFDEASALYD